MTFQDRAYKQARMVRKYAKVLGVDEDTAGLLWVSRGLAFRWAEQN